MLILKIVCLGKKKLIKFPTNQRVSKEYKSRSFNHLIWNLQDKRNVPKITINHDNIAPIWPILKRVSLLAKYIKIKSSPAPEPPDKYNNTKAYEMQSAPSKETKILFSSILIIDSWGKMLIKKGSNVTKIKDLIVNDKLFFFQLQRYKGILINHKIKPKVKGFVKPFLSKNWEKIVATPITPPGIKFKGIIKYLYPIAAIIVAINII